MVRIIEGNILLGYIDVPDNMPWSAKLEMAQEVVWGYHMAVMCYKLPHPVWN